MNLRSRGRFCALACAAVLAGCGSLNPVDMLRGGRPGPKPAPLPAITSPQPAKLLWSSSIGSADRFAFSPAVAGDSVYVAARSGAVARLDAATGQARWRVALDTRLSGGVGSDGRIAVVANEEGDVFALDAHTGALRWRARVSSEVLSAPAIGEDLVVVRSADNRLFALGVQDGKRRWVYQRSGTSLIVRTPTGIAIEEGTAYVGFSGGKLVAIAMSNGGVRWEGTVALPKGATELERVADVVGEPALQGREICAATFQGRVACFERATGRQLWARDVSTLTGVSLDARYAFVSDDRGAVHAFDRSSGRSVWKQDGLAHRGLSMPLPLGNSLALADFEGYVHFIARETGVFVGRYSTGSAEVRAAPVQIPGGFLVQTASGALFALAQ
jgi:outer membrane protein assembly factor BamB